MKKEMIKRMKKIMWTLPFSLSPTIVSDIVKINSENPASRRVYLRIVDTGWKILVEKTEDFLTEKDSYLLVVNELTVEEYYDWADRDVDEHPEMPYRSFLRQIDDSRDRGQERRLKIELVYVTEYDQICYTKTNTFKSYSD